MRTAYKPQMTRKKLKALCKRALAAKTLDESADIIERYARQCSRAWRKMLLKLAAGLRKRQAAFKVFTHGNSKLPFWSFSALPLFTCPGAGDCLEWCYSFTAWRYPAAFCRQLQNTLLLRFAKGVVSREFLALAENAIVRLYVDGDIDNLQTMGFWFGLLRRRPDVNAYGYSKSWALFAQWHAQRLPWPANYRLNLSSGSIHDSDNGLRELMESLPITRGRFVAVDVRGHYARGFARYADKTYHHEVRSATRAEFGTNRVFSCPGNCGDCMPDGAHACGDDRMRGVLVSIGVH